MEYKRHQNTDKQYEAWECLGSLGWEEENRREDTVDASYSCLSVCLYLKCTYRYLCSRGPTASPPSWQDTLIPCQSWSPCISLCLFLMCFFSISRSHSAHDYTQIKALLQSREQETRAKAVSLSLALISDWALLFKHLWRDDWITAHLPVQNQVIPSSLLYTAWQPRYLVKSTVSNSTKWSHQRL